MKIRSVVVALGCIGLAACGGSDSASAAVTLSGPGFTATTVHGTAGGPQAGSALGSDCIGQFPASPQHTVTVGAAIPMLRVLVNGGADADTTLAVRRPDGSVVC